MVEQFHRPRSIPEALRLKRRFAGRSAFLAGGTVANAKGSPLHPDHWINLAGLKCDRIDEKRGDLVIGALCPLQQVIDDARTPEPLRAAAAQIASRNIRNLATIGGHVAANLPYTDLLPMLVALEAQVELPGPRTVKTIPVLDYLAAAATSGQTPLITKVIVPRARRLRPAACGNVRGSAIARSLLSVAVSVAVTGRAAGRKLQEEMPPNPALTAAIVLDPIIAISGVAPHVVRLTSVEKALHGKPLPPADKLEALISRGVRPASTPFASAPYIKHQAGVVVARAMQEALRPKGDRG